MYPGRYAALHPDLPAFIMASTGAEVSYREFEERCNRLAHLLRDHGLGREDHFSILMENNDRYLEACGAGERAGLYYTCVNSYLTAEELAYIVNDCGARAYITSKYKSEQAEELQAQQEELRTTNEELESSNEELKSTNEELQSSNEELQSTNEELQSVNEELYTVNAEHQQKIVELTELHNDLFNLPASSHIYTLFLDEDLAVRKFTPALDAVFPLIQTDVGRPFEHLRHHLVGADPLEVVHEVERTGRPGTVEVSSREGGSYLLRVLPYQVAEGLAAGIVLTLLVQSSSAAMAITITCGLISATAITGSAVITYQSQPTARYGARVRRRTTAIVTAASNKPLASAARASSPSSSGSSSSSSSSSSRSRCPSDSSATSTAGRSPWRSSPAWLSPSSPSPSTAWRSS